MAITQTTQAGTTYSPDSADDQTIVRFTNASQVTVTIDPTSTASWTDGTIFNLRARGAGGITLAEGAGVTIRGDVDDIPQYGEVSLAYDGSDEWVATRINTSTVNVVATSGATETINFAHGLDEIVHAVTMDQACTFSFGNTPASGTVGTMVLELDGAFTPTLPGTIEWDAGTAPTYGSPTVYVFWTRDGGTTVYGSTQGESFA